LLKSYEIFVQTFHKPKVLEARFHPLKAQFLHHCTHQSAENFSVQGL